jgi:hypothetical protein
MVKKKLNNMKIFLSRLLVITAGVFALQSCHDITTEDQSIITYYVTFDMKGNAIETVELGTPYVEPGVTATENDVDKTSSMQISGEVNSDEAGVYILTYSAVNEDGYPSSIERMVIVYDPETTDLETDISGEYTSEEGTHRLVLSSGATVAYSGYPVVIDPVAPGIFYVSDYFGGYYDKRAGYGKNYAMTGYFALNKDHTITLLSSHVNGWGDALDELNDATYDPETGIITWGAVYVGSYSFNLILTE